MGKKLRVGLLFDSYQIHHWEYRMVEKIMGSDYAEIVLLIKKDDLLLIKKKQYSNARSTFVKILLSAYWELDQSLNKQDPSAFEPRDFRLFSSNIPGIVVRPIPQVTGECFSEADCDKVRAYELDVLIALGFGTLSGNVLSSAKYGIWACQQNDDGINPLNPASFREFCAGLRDSDVKLKILTEEFEEERVLCKSYAQTAKLSISSYLNIICWKSATFIPRKLRELHSLGEKTFSAQIQQENQHPVFYSRTKFVVPQTLEFLSLLLQHMQKIISVKLRKVFYFDQYVLLFDISQHRGLSSMLSNFKKLMPPHDRFWADPFVVYEDKKYYIFVEEVIAPSPRGHISCFEIDENGNPSVPKKIIERPYHMSYPYVFSYNNEYYMIPETSENRTIDLYKCVNFPEKWAMVTTLMQNIEAADATLFQKDGKWWLFANVCENEGTPSNDELCLFYAEDLFAGKWTAHAKNPIVSDVKSARPAGKIFIHNGEAYRPSQNSSKRYGYGMKINHIVTLSETEYEEVCISDIEPLWDDEIIATHTLNFVNELTIIDGLMKQVRYPTDFLRYFRRRWGSTH